MSDRLTRASKIWLAFLVAAVVLIQWGLLNAISHR